MRKALRIVGLLVGLVVLAGAGFAVFVSARGIPSYTSPKPAVAAIEATPTRIELGEKLTLAACGDCHLNRETNKYSGHLLQDLTPDFGKVYSANITQDRAHGIGAWTDQELVGLLRTGIGRDGRYRVIMPSFALMSDEDVASIVAFLRSGSPQVQADATPSHSQEPSFLLKALTNTVMKPTPLPAAPVLAPAPTEAVAYGRYLVVGRYKCYECHSKDFKSNNPLEPEKSDGYLGGGNRLLNMQGQTVVSRNITGDADTGIGDWSEAQFGQALRFGTTPHGPLNYPMPKYSRLDDAEIHALFAYLQSVPKLKNVTPEDGAVAAK
ncbi:c-type cytochrome [Hymenobacter sp. M29]|uniref:C-type cytochrome n=1 Tax=Hymenobacter mellowenesis TaxID=3063995 RepID=A0ABT9A781_9BACT|nr:c-type cytochrome [Hymenobacter sp. M29]MDO7845679.1 c-type cytochrome [Hymenobacter sp. M29]